MRGLHELLTARFFNIDPVAAAGYRKILESNLNGHVPFVGTEKVIGRKVSAKTGVVIEDTRISTESGMEVSRYNDNQDDPFINVLIIDGPMTRMGDACSYGSIDHRDMMLSAANNANCVGHLFIVNTPGGTEWTHNDYQQAIDYAHSKNQPVVMWIDGICMSAGMYLASMCDKIFYMHPKDQVGCIGTMACFYTMKNGEKDFNGETYHEIYDPESFDKNKDFRDIAENDDDKLLVEDLTRLGAEFRTAIKNRFPKAKDEQIHGKIFYAEDVKGVFLDGQTDMGGAFNETIKLAKKMGNPASVNASAVSVSGMAQGATATAKGATASNQNNQPQNKMNKKYQNVATILGIEELGVKTDSQQAVENGSFLNLEQLDKMEQGLTELKAKAEKADALEAQCKKAQEERDSMENVSKQRQAQLEELQKENDTLKAEKADLEKAKKASDDKVAELEQSVKDKDEQIANISKDPGENANAGASPENNGTGAQEQHIAATRPVFDAQHETYAQFMQRQEKWEAEHGK